MRRIRFQLLIPLLLAVLAACENNAVAPEEEDTLTQAEASALIKGLYGEGVMGGDLLESDKFQLGAPIPLEGTFACSGGGTSALAGTMTISANEAETSVVMEFDAALTMADCAFVSEGIAFTLNSEEGLSFTGGLSADAEAARVTGDMRVSGPVAWAIGERAGTCQLDNAITVTASLAADEPEATITGTVCGLAI